MMRYETGFETESWDMYEEVRYHDITVVAATDQVSAQSADNSFNIGGGNAWTTTPERGQWIHVSGFPQAENNGHFRVDPRSAPTSQKIVVTQRATSTPGVDPLGLLDQVAGPAVTIVDQNPEPPCYDAATFPVIAAADNFISAQPNELLHSGTWHRTPLAGEWILVEGFTDPANNGYFHVDPAGAPTANQIPVLGALVVEAAGPPVTITPQPKPLIDEMGDQVSAYTEGAGVVARSTEAARRGNYGLLVHANAMATRFGNHVQARYQHSTEHVTGRWRYEFRVRIPSVLDDQFVGQVAPDFSLQNTKETPLGSNVFISWIAGLQYIVNPEDARLHRWNIWEGGWKPLVDAAGDELLEVELQRGRWYRITMEIDYGSLEADEPVYRWFKIRGKGANKNVDLSDWKIVPENKGWDEEAYYISLEAENLYTNCDAAMPRWLRVHFDQVKLRGWS